MRRFGGEYRPLMAGGKMGKLSPAPVEKIPRSERKDHDCDACGVTQIDGARIAAAKYEVLIGTGRLYFCGYHLRTHWAHILEHGYEVLQV
jgi:hypothetical protein